MTITPPPPPVWDAEPPEVLRLRYAGFWLRVLAAIIDAIVLAILSKIIDFFLPSPPSPPVPFDNFDALLAYANATAAPLKLVANALLVWAYFALQESSQGEGTIGKRLVGIRVTTDEGLRLSLGTASIRAWPMYLPNVAFLAAGWLGWLLFWLGFIACLSVVFSVRKQGLHDRMAGAILTRR
jgi:uncharacterized RDD family membrane protein YckC